MTEKELRQELVSRAVRFAGAKKGSDLHHYLVDVYNSYLPHPRNYALTYADDWCAGFVGALSILCGMTKIIPVECSCSQMITLLKVIGAWQELDSYTPSPGDLLLYDWQDSGKGDNTGGPDHISIVVWVERTFFRVIEGNMGEESVVGYRDVPIDGRYIRGFGVPDFGRLAANEPTETNPSTDDDASVLPVLSYGDKGETVRAVQALLNLRLGAKLSADGSFGPATKTATKQYQERCGLTTTEKIDLPTWRRLLAL